MVAAPAVKCPPYRKSSAVDLIQYTTHAYASE